MHRLYCWFENTSDIYLATSSVMKWRRCHNPGLDPISQEGTGPHHSDCNNNNNNNNNNARIQKVLSEGVQV